MEAVQKLSVPISIVIAGAMIAGAVFFVNGGGGKTSGGPSYPTVAEEIRTVQDNDHIKGDRGAEVVIVEYSDTECPFCKRFHDTLNQVVSTYSADNKVAWVYRHFPIPSLHPKAQKEAEALECAAEMGGNEGFWKFTDLVYTTTKANNSLDIGAYNVPKEVPIGPDGKPYYQQLPARHDKDARQLTEIAEKVGLNGRDFEECLASGRHAERVQADANEVAASGGGGTPHSILLVGDEQIPIEGALPFESITGQTPGYKEILDAILNRGPLTSAAEAVAAVFAKY